MNYEPRETGLQKKPYEAPKLIRVSLRPEEAVLGNCKFAGTAGPAAASCVSLACSSPGS
jgi:hypothetical protein